MALSNAKPPPLVRLRDVHVIYDRLCALDIEEWTVAHGERIFLLGQSGSGKTTLLRVIKGRAQPTSGEARVFGENPALRGSTRRDGVQRRIAMVDQDFHLVPQMRLIENVLTGCLGRTPLWRSMLGAFSKADGI